MSTMNREFGFLAGLAAVVLLVSATSASPAKYPALVFLAVTGLVLWLTRSWPDRVFYLACAGEILVVSVAIANPWAGMFAIWMLAGLAGSALGLLGSRGDFPVLLLFFGGSLLVTALIQVSAHVILPILVLAAATGLLLGVQAVRNYQFRKSYSGVRP